MTYLALLMTGLCGFLSGVLFCSKRDGQKKETPKHIKKKPQQIDYLSAEYKNFLDYDGSEQA